MSLKDKIKISGAPDRQKVLFERFGIVENPFPSASQPIGHPRFDATKEDDRVVDAIRQFDRDHSTQVMVIEGTQGVGKTNLLNYYQEQLEELYANDGTFYIIRYYPDPEPTFDAIVRRVFQEIGSGHLVEIGNALADGETNRDELIEEARGHEIRMLMHRLKKAASTSEGELQAVADAALEWLMGLRLLNRHRDLLGVHFRLDTVESKTQALRDIVFISEGLDLLRGIFLLLDELEKQDYSQSKTAVLRYLSAIRALIDALPRRLFLMLAITSEARRRYFAMLPAIASRLQNRVVLSPLMSENEAVELADFYVKASRARAKTLPLSAKWRAGSEDPVERDDISKLFKRALANSADRGFEGVTHRDFLNALRSIAERRMEVSVSN